MRYIIADISKEADTKRKRRKTKDNRARCGKIVRNSSTYNSKHVSISNRKIKEYFRNWIYPPYTLQNERTQAHQRTFAEITGTRVCVCLWACVCVCVSYMYSMRTVWMCSYARYTGCIKCRTTCMCKSEPLCISYENLLFSSLFFTQTHTHTHTDKLWVCHSLFHTRTHTHITNRGKKHRAVSEYIVCTLWYLCIRRLYGFDTM